MNRSTAARRFGGALQRSRFEARDFSFRLDHPTSDPADSKFVAPCILGIFRATRAIVLMLPNWFFDMSTLQRRLVIWSVIGVGISSVNVQLVTIREFLSQFQGNEIVISLTLFCWLAHDGSWQSRGQTRQERFAHPLCSPSAVPIRLAPGADRPHSNPEGNSLHPRGFTRFLPRPALRARHDGPLLPGRRLHPALCARGLEFGAPAVHLRPSLPDGQPGRHRRRGLVHVRPGLLAEAFCHPGGHLLAAHPPGLSAARRDQKGPSPVAGRNPGFHLLHARAERSFRMVDPRPSIRRDPSVRGVPVRKDRGHRRGLSAHLLGIGGAPLLGCGHHAKRGKGPLPPLPVEPGRERPAGIRGQRSGRERGSQTRPRFHRLRRA